MKIKKRKWIILTVLLLVAFTGVVLAYDEYGYRISVKSLFSDAVRVRTAQVTGAEDTKGLKSIKNQVKRAYYIYDKQNNKTGMGFIVKGQGYKGNITAAAGIDLQSGRTAGIKILQHMETPHYGGHITETWFTERFKDRNAADFLNLAPLEENTPQDIVMVTGATMSSMAVVDAVNAAIGAYNLMENQKLLEKPVMSVEKAKLNEEGTFVIRYGEGKELLITEEVLRSFETVSTDCILQKSTGTKIKMVAEGPLLETVLNKYGISLKDFKGIGITGRDGYYAMISQEILQGSRIILGYTFNGKPIPEEERPIRIVIPEEFGVYWVKMVSKIDLYDDISEKNIRSVKIFDALTREIKPYKYEYYGKKDDAIEVGKILAKLDTIDEKGFFTMVSSDGLMKNESIAMVKQRYYIKTTGEGAPMNVMPSFKLGMNVKNIAFFSTTTAAVIFPEEVAELVEEIELEGQSGMPLAAVLEQCGMKNAENKCFDLIACNKESVRIMGEDLKQCILVSKDKRVSAVIRTKQGIKTLEDLLEINETE